MSAVAWSMLLIAVSQCMCDALQISSTTEVAVHTEGLVFSRGSSGAWDSAAVGNPVVGLAAVQLPLLLGARSSSSCCCRCLGCHRQDVG